MLSLAFLTHEPFFPLSGGGSAEAIYLVRELVKRGHIVHLFCPALGDSSATARDFGIQIHEFKLWKMSRYARFRNFKYLLYPFFLQKLVQSHAANSPFDFLLSQHAISAVAAGRLRAVLRVPVVMNFLDYLTGFMETWPPLLAPPPLLKRLKNFELHLPLRYRADGVLTVSDTLADHFANAGYERERLRPIFYGYDPALFPFRGLPPEREGRPPLLVMHGSLDHHHLGRIAVEALAIVAERWPGLRLRIVGQRTAALQRFTKQAAEKAPQLQIEATGFVSYEKIAPLLAEADLGIVPYEESIGTHCAFVAKIVEYLAVGLPVASTRLESARRYFGKEPRIRFAGFSGAAFGQAMVEWINDLPRERERLAEAENASNRVKRELDWQIISRRAIDFVEETNRRSAFEPHGAA